MVLEGKKNEIQVVIKAKFLIYFGKYISKIIPMNSDRIIEINKVLVRKEIVEIPFNCDLNRCKGACCTLESELGAPVKKEEISILENILPEVKKYLPERNINAIEHNGFYEEKSGEFLLKSLNNRECVFVVCENDIAKCAIEKAYFDGKVKFRKPISCHLFPIRVSDFGGDILRYEKFSECSPALEKGKAENTTIAEFCKESLVRSYGENWYSQLMNHSGK